MRPCRRKNFRHNNFYSSEVFDLNEAIRVKLKMSSKQQVVVLNWKQASNTTLNGNGRWFNGGRPTQLIIKSQFYKGEWRRPQNFEFTNWKLNGSIRILGAGSSASNAVKQSSFSLGHTERMQAAAPSGITLSNLQINAIGKIPLIVGPGSTQVALRNSTISGRSQSVGIYLDAESANNEIVNNTFSLKLDREVIAVDGSRQNVISSNTFARLPWGGVYVYRNCGERGVVRHQEPAENRILANTFNLNTLRSFWEKNPKNGRQFEYRYGIWLGSRESRPPSYCGADRGYSFGSSINNGDFANDNIINGNLRRGSSRGYLLKIDEGLGVGGYDKFIKDDGRNNQINKGPLGSMQARRRNWEDALGHALSPAGSHAPSRNDRALLAALPGGGSECGCSSMAAAEAMGLA